MNTENRRNFLKKATLGALFLPVRNFGRFVIPPDQNFITLRPPAVQRKFVSKKIDEVILKVKKEIKNPELAWMFENCFPNTLDTTVRHYWKDGKPYTYVITGDIDAMWLRDSSAQVWPYLPFLKQDTALDEMVQGLINKQTDCVLLDPYANAFYDDVSKKSDWANDLTEMKPGVHERKWEIDSLCYVIRLAHGYWKTSGKTSVFDAHWKGMAQLIVKTFHEQQRLHSDGPYHFQREATTPTDTQFGGGYGNPTKKIGLIHSMFRPSDDSVFYPFLISSNMFAVVSLRQLAEISLEVYHDRIFAEECTSFATGLENLIEKYGSGMHPTAGKIYALEVDGYGNTLFMDDANVPNLLSIPYLGYKDSSDALYQNTRKFSLSTNNPWYYKGKFGAGIGGPHIGINKIWPLGIIMQAMTSNDDSEITACISTLKNTHAGTGFIHESFDVDNSNDFTRKWFAWANTLFGELILHLYQTKPHLLHQSF